MTAYVDSEAVTKIVSNLITNAIKYGRTYIDIELLTTPQDFNLIISNDGDIVAPEKREEIFTLFSRLVTNKNVPGTGLGLAYARSLAQMHAGTLSMTDSVERNEFILSIPLMDNGQEGKNEVEEASARDLEQMIKSNSQALTILVVDDNMEMLKWMRTHEPRHQS